MSDSDVDHLVVDSDTGLSHPHNHHHQWHQTSSPVTDTRSALPAGDALNPSGAESAFVLPAVTYHRPSLLVRSPVDGPPPSATDQLSPRRRPYRTSSAASAANPPPSSSIRSSVKPRQPSFRDLVSKFNTHRDEVLPIPSNPGSRTASRNTSPAPSRFGGPTRSTHSFHRSRATHETSTAGGHPFARWDLPTTSARQHSPERSSAARRPLFGELLTIDTAVHGPGYGIPSHMRRRGSESSISSPIPASRDRGHDHHANAVDPASGFSPLTPTAWYLGRTPFLEAVSTDARGTRHRRSRSDLGVSASASRQFSDRHSLTPQMAVPSPFGVRNPPSGASDPSSHAKSRIPISSRRFPHSTSDSEGPSPSPTARSAAPFALRTSHNVALAPKGTSRLPKPSPRPSPPSSRGASSPVEVTSPKRREVTRPPPHRPQRLDKGRLLAAYVTESPPTRSPPLRSSRPRQPVSSATTAASRSRVVDRVSSFQRQLNHERDWRYSRPRDRRLPEITNVDFAARRQKIQQAFNRTVEENARKEQAAEETRRRRAARGPTASGEKGDNDGDTDGNRQPPADQSPSTDDITPTIASRADHTYAAVPQQSVDETIAVVPTIAGPTGPRTGPRLTIDTDVTLEESNGAHDDGQPVTQDSPTLGLMAPFSSKHQSDDATTNAVPTDPASAVTSASNDTHITTFDPEPQTELPQPQTPHRTLLNQIMLMRESSPSSPSSCNEPDLAFSDTDHQRESVPIMLRQTAYYDDSTDSGGNRESCDYNDAQPEVGPDAHHHRWSVSSWSPSLQRQQSAEEQCGATSCDEVEAPRRSSIPESDTTLPSCSASTAPPSESGQRSTGLGRSELASEQCDEDRAQKYTPLFYDPPSLVRQGGYDSRRVTQLYLRELARGRIPHLPQPPPPQPVPASREAGLGRDDKRADGRTDSLTEDPVLVSKADAAQSSERIDHTASLVFRDDWEHASPSIADWMQVAAESSDENKSATPLCEGLPTPRLPSAAPMDADNQGLGLAIRAQGPQELDSVGKRPPSVPHHSPQPPNPPADAQDSYFQPVSSSIYSSHRLPTRTESSGGFAPLAAVPSAGSSEDSSLRRAGPTPSPGTFESSTTSLVPSSHDQVPADGKKGSPSPEQRRLRKRRNVIKELVDTEYGFGRDMKVVDDIYKGTSSSCLDLSADDVKILFGNSDQIVQFSMNFQDALKKASRSVYVMPRSERWSRKRDNRAAKPETPQDETAPAAAGVADPSETEKDHMTSIGQVFVAHMDQMEKVYADYLRNHDAANKKLQSLQKNPKVAIWLKECRDWASDLTTAWDLDSLLVKPVQRILKYPLLLSELLDATPADHPDHASLVSALQGVTNISVRINEMKKRADVVGQVVGRKRKESDVRAGLSRAFGRRTEKLRQQVGLSDMFEDKEYDSLSQQFGDGFFQLQVVMRDVEMYTQEARGAMERLNDLVLAIEGLVDVSPSSYTELESKWRRLRMSVRDIMTVALPDHLDSVRKHVIDPMVTLLKLHEGPQRVMRKRDKRLMDYARFKAIKDRGDKPDRKTREQGEQFDALNDALKDELPKLYALTAKLMEACLDNFVEIQATWYSLLQKKLGHLVDAFPHDINKIVTDWSGDFTFSDAQVLSLGICNGSLLAETVNLVDFGTPSTSTGGGAHGSSPRRPSTVTSTGTHVGSPSLVDESPKVSQEYSRGSNSFQSARVHGQPGHSTGGARRRTDSAVSGTTAATAAAAGGGHGHETSSHAPPRFPMSQRSSTEPALTAGTLHTVPNEPFPSLPRLSLDTASLAEVMINVGSSSSSSGGDNPPTSPGGRYSGFFSSAMPMSDSPDECGGGGPARPLSGPNAMTAASTTTTSAAPGPPQQRPSSSSAAAAHSSSINEDRGAKPKVLFLAASIYEFNIDRARREAGYPYLTYVAGEIFDVIAEKGELWLAINQDDPTRQVGWIWNKHFAKLAA